MYKPFMLAACLVLGACSSTPPAPGSAPQMQQDLARSNLEAIHNAQVIPLPLNRPAVKASGKANSTPMGFGSSLSNYRVYSLQLQKGERYRLNVSTRCDDTCMGINKFALKPRALLMDDYGAVIAGKPAGQSAVIGVSTLGWDGEAAEDGTYYLLVAADEEDLGRTTVIDDIWINNSPLMAVKVGMLGAGAPPRALR